MGKEIILKLVCVANEKVFSENWNDIPKEDQDIITSQDGLACSNDGEIGLFCDGCHYLVSEQI